MHVTSSFDVLGQAEAMPQPGRPSAWRARLRCAAIDLARQETLVDAAYSYRIAALERRPAPADAFLHAGGEKLAAASLIPAAGRLTALACCVCSIGPLLEKRVSALFSERCPSLAVALDELGNELLFAVARLAQDRLHADVRRRRLSMAGELHAGDPGLDLADQAAVLRLAGSGNVGVALLHGSVMSPLKSVATVFGVGIALPPGTWSRCERCPSRAKCGTGARAEAPAPAAAPAA